MHANRFGIAFDHYPNFHVVNSIIKSPRFTCQLLKCGLYYCHYCIVVPHAG